MIRIDNITRGRWGNKIFQYNNLIQLAHNLNTEASCCHWEGNNYFKNIVSFKNTDKFSRIIYWNEILDKNKEELNELLEEQNLLLDDPSYALHNTYYKLTHIDPRNFLELKNKFIPNLDSQFTYIGIHIRGGDILGGDGQEGREIHTPDYYKKSIKYITSIKDKHKCIFIVCTDDIQFESTKETIEYLQENNLRYQLGPNYGTTTFINDFAILCYCDILINSSSTFCCAAVFIGKKNKYIIHSQDWINRIVNCDFSNQDYKKYIKIHKNKQTDTEWQNTRKPIQYWKDLQYNKLI